MPCAYSTAAYGYFCSSGWAIPCFPSSSCRACTPWVGGYYWLSSAFAFAPTSVLSLYLNKRFSFRTRASVKHTAWRFALVIGVCYLLAYSAAQPATAWLLDRLLSPHALKVSNDQIALFVGQVLFTGLNYLGQRFFAFAGDKGTGGQ